MKMWSVRLSRHAAITNHLSLTNFLPLGNGNSRQVRIEGRHFHWMPQYHVIPVLTASIAPREVDRAGSASPYWSYFTWVNCNINAEWMPRSEVARDPAVVGPDEACGANQVGDRRRRCGLRWSRLYGLSESQIGDA